MKKSFVFLVNYLPTKRVDRNPETFLYARLSKTISCKGTVAVKNANI